MIKVSNPPPISQALSGEPPEFSPPPTDASWASETLERAYDSKVSRLWREYHKWDYKNPEATTIPSHFAPLFNAEERRFQAEVFRPKTRTQVDQAKLIKKEIEAELPDRNKRREQENKLADYVEAEIQPLGPIYFSRGDSMGCDYPQAIVEKLRSCRTDGTLAMNQGGKKIVFYTEKCGYSKFCPDEARQETQRLSETDIPAINAFLNQDRRHTFQYAVFTLPNYPAGDLEFGLKDIRERWNRLRALKCMESVAGVRIVLEAPLSAHDDWNIHLNVMLLINGPFDWKAVREAWGFNIHFESAEQMERKTRQKLMRQGVDVSGMTTATVLAHAYLEICKYAGAPVSSKSDQKAAEGTSKAPPMIEWPPERFREFWVGMKGFRRSWANGILFDAHGYRWTVATDDLRKAWLGEAKLSTALAASTWRRGDSPLDKVQREAVRDVMDGRPDFNIEDFEVIGRLSYDRATGYAVHINLIPEDKYGSQVGSEPEISSISPTGPPEIPPDEGYMEAFYREYG